MVALAQAAEVHLQLLLEQAGLIVDLVAVLAVLDKITQQVVEVVDLLPILRLLLLLPAEMAMD